MQSGLITGIFVRKLIKKVGYEVFQVYGFFMKKLYNSQFDFLHCYKGMAFTTIFMIDLTLPFWWHRYSNMGCLF